MKPDQSFAISIGLVDGLITSLMITAYAIVYNLPVSTYTALHIAFGSSFVGSVSYFIAEFSKLSKSEFQVAKALKPGKKVSQSIKKVLSERILLESVYGGSASFIMGFIGASIPLFSYVGFHNMDSISLGLSYLSLSLFGAYTAKVTGGSYAKWVSGLIILGVVMTIIGTALRIVS